MTARLIVLGSLLRRKQAHGYQIMQDVRDWEADQWSGLKPGSIYHALTQLQKQGFVRAKSTESSALGPKKTRFVLTPSGTDYFESLCLKSLESTDLKIFAAGLAFMHLIPRDKVLLALQTAQQQHTDYYNYISSLQPSALLDDPSQNPELMALWAVHHYQAAVHVAGIMQRLQKDKYEAPALNTIQV